MQKMTSAECRSFLLHRTRTAKLATVRVIPTKILAQKNIAE